MRASCVYQRVRHLYYDGEGVNKSLEEAYIWYQVAQCAGNHRVASLAVYVASKLMKHTNFTKKEPLAPVRTPSKASSRLPAMISNKFVIRPTVW